MDDETRLEQSCQNLMEDEDFNIKISLDNLKTLVSPLKKFAEHDVALNDLCGQLIVSKNLSKTEIRDLLHEISSRCAKTIGSCNALLEATRNIVSDLTLSMTKSNEQGGDI